MSELSAEKLHKSIIENHEHTGSLIVHASVDWDVNIDRTVEPPHVKLKCIDVQASYLLDGACIYIESTDGYSFFVDSKTEQAALAELNRQFGGR